MQGFAAAEYGCAYAEWGDIYRLPHSGAQVLQRRLARATDFDAFGLYPYTVGTDWAGFDRDLNVLREMGAISFTMVSDPLAEQKARAACQSWTIFRPLKTHQMVNLRKPWRTDLRRNTRYYARRAIEHQSVEVDAASKLSPGLFWRLYSNLIDRHHLSGAHRMSATITEKLFAVPGAMVATVRDVDGICGQILFFVRENVVDLHLQGVTKRAYGQASSYALYFGLLEYLEEGGFAIVNLGGAPGYRDDPENGLQIFKRGWANERHTAFLCGQVLDEERYAKLTETEGASASDFFPAYRTPADYPHSSGASDGA